MAAWLPIIRIVLPYVAPIVHATLPAFTKKKNGDADSVISRQIGELQEAVKANSEATRALAKAIEASARANDRAIKRAYAIAVFAVSVALVSLGLVLASKF
jgi:hypothetical protein